MTLKLNKQPEAESNEALRQIQAKGDFTLAAEAIRNPDVVLTPELREIIAAKLTGQFHATRGRKKSTETMVKAIEAHQVIWWLTRVEGWSRDAAKKRVEEIFNVSLRTVDSWEALVNDPEFSRGYEMSFIERMTNPEHLVSVFQSIGKTSPEELSFLKPTILRRYEESRPIENYIAARVKLIEEK